MAEGGRSEGYDKLIQWLNEEHRAIHGIDERTDLKGLDVKEALREIVTNFLPSTSLQEVKDDPTVTSSYAGRDLERSAGLFPDNVGDLYNYVMSLMADLRIQRMDSTSTVPSEEDFSSSMNYGDPVKERMDDLDDDNSSMEDIVNEPIDPQEREREREWIREALTPHDPYEEVKCKPERRKKIIHRPIDKQKRFNHHERIFSKGCGLSNTKSFGKCGIFDDLIQQEAKRRKKILKESAKLDKDVSPSSRPNVFKPESRNEDYQRFMKGTIEDIKKRWRKKIEFRRDFLLEMDVLKADESKGLDQK